MLFESNSHPPTDEHAMLSNSEISFARSNWAKEAARNIYFVKGEGVFDHSTVTRWLKNFPL